MVDIPDDLTGGLSEDLTAVGSNRLMAFFWIATAVSLILPRIPYGRHLLYPFALLGTWAHEMGHGLVAIMAGGTFNRLVIYQNLGGTAYSSGVGTLGRAFVSAGGLLGPALAGGAIIILGSRESTARWVLAGLAILLALSLVLFVRNAFGVLALALIAALLGAAAAYGPDLLKVFVAQLIGIQFCLASWSTLDYMFTKNFRRDGQVIDSDTQEIAEVLLLPYWFWGGLIALLSFGIMASSFYVAWVRPFRQSG
ncbi:MAG: M50 family metallopeptidase [Acidimicrobiales bacterium]